MRKHKQKNSLSDIESTCLKMNTAPQTAPIVNELNSHVVVLHTATMARLLKEDTNAFTLYSFYCYVSGWQNNNQVRATDAFCKQGLGWGDWKFKAAKKILTELGIVKSFVKNVNGKNQTFVRVGYLSSKANRAELVLSPTSLSRNTNALDKNNKINAIRLVSKDTNRETLKESFGNTDVNSILEDFTQITGYSQPTDKNFRQWAHLFAKNKGVKLFRPCLEFLINHKKYDINKLETVYRKFPVYEAEVLKVKATRESTSKVRFTEDGGFFYED